MRVTTHFLKQTLKGLPRTVALGAMLAPLAVATPMLLAQDQTTAPAATQGQEMPDHHGRHMDPAERQQKMLDMMTKKLSLTPDQVSQVKAIQADTLQQQQTLMADSSKGADRRSKMMDLHKSERDKIRGVLTDEQKAKFDAMEARRQEHMHGGEQNPPPPAA